MHTNLYACVCCVYVCKREVGGGEREEGREGGREGGRERKRERERKRDKPTPYIYTHIRIAYIF